MTIPEKQIPGPPAKRERRTCARRVATTDGGDLTISGNLRVRY
jgi:hypothetical protein